MRAVRFRELAAVVALASAFTLACGEEGPPPQADRPPPPPATRDSLSAVSLGGLDASQITVNLPWSSGSISRENPGGQEATLTRVDLSMHEGFDRLMLTFADDAPLPGYSIAPNEELDVRACDRGSPIGIQGRIRLQLTLEPARARDSGGNPTFTTSSETAGLTAMKGADLICDEDGKLDWIIGMDRATTYRVLQLRTPPRLVLDLRHP